MSAFLVGSLPFTVRASLSTISLKEAIEIRDMILSRIDEIKDDMRSQFISQQEERIKQEAIDLDFDYTDFKIEVRKSNRSAVKPKYRDPAKPYNTWTGRGKKPSWLIDLLATGMTLESLLIQPDSKVDPEVEF